MKGKTYPQKDGEYVTANNTNSITVNKENQITYQFLIIK